MSLTWQSVAVFTLLAVLMQSIGLSLFVIGFFPVKPALSGVGGVESYESGCNSNEEIENMPPDRLRSLYAEKSGIPVQFDRLIFMVIDGLPAEFVLGKGRDPPPEMMMEYMPYTQSLLSNGRAFGYHARAAPPTVTMPRLKAMTSGAIAGFLDVAFNFNTQAFLDDNILGQLARAGWQMVMLGDETWLRLFPSLFMREDGVTSFYVKDTIEVDRNVTRHVEDELISTDWDLLILHYLGLDHVGHTGGRTSSLMGPKLSEMDKIIEKLHMSLVMNSGSTTRRTLLMVVSDHGMTDGGNHGGSSFEETDALAIFVPSDAAPSTDATSAPLHSAFQVDIAPTLALLLGVPIPKNSVGVLLPHLFHSFTDEQRLRALELNSWQLLRLLKARLPNSKCIISLCNNETHNECLEREIGGEQTDARLCYLFRRAIFLHDSWRQQESCLDFRDQCIYVKDSKFLVDAYTEFVRTASEYLARGNTEKPSVLLALGGFLMLGSLVLLLGISFRVCKALSEMSECLALKIEKQKHTGKLEKIIAVFGICIHVLSLGASSLVEEEQYTWHFLLSTLFITLIHRACQVWNSQPEEKIEFFWSQDPLKLRGNFNYQCPNSNMERPNTTSRLNCEHEKSLHDQQFSTCQLLAIMLVLIAGRLLRSWHQGGVNWVYLPDIAKWLDYSGPHVTKSLQIASVLTVMLIGFSFFLAVKPRKFFQYFVATNILTCGISILLFVLWHQDQNMPSLDYWPTLMARLVYTSLGLTALTTLLVFPWTISLPNSSSLVVSKSQKPGVFVGSESFSGITKNYIEAGTGNCISFVGMVYILCWCLLQLLLQQPVNACPIVILLLQLISMANYFYNSRSHHKEWVMVITMYWLGMSGHFGLGNSNSLATVDVAGAYIGLSNHSTVLSGLLLFIITYASPFLFLFGSLLCSSFTEGRNHRCTEKEDGNSGYFALKSIALPCVVPLALNSVVLVGFTGILFLMRNHLFVWSVFSPKYLYVCATTICIYIATFFIAITGLYVNFVMFARSKSSLFWNHMKTRKLKFL